MIYLVLFIAGTMVGSFLNVCIYRLPRKESIVKPRSHCPHCGKMILWHDNIPIFSFIKLRGKCRYCKKPISLRYMVVETVAGAICVLFFVRFGFTIESFILWALANSLIIVSAIDLRFHEIPDEITLPGIAIGLALATIFPQLMDSSTRLSSLWNSFLGVLAGGGSIYLLGFIGEFLFKREAMGGGDVKLMAMIGSFVGWKLVLMAFFIAPFFGSIVGIVLKIREGKDIIPYGPYLSLAALIAIFYGEEILKRLFLL